MLYYPVGIFKKRRGLIYTRNLKYWKSKIILKSEVVNILKSYDAVLPVQRKFKYSIKEHYNKYHNINDLILIEKIIKENCQEYIESYNIILKGNTMFANNMFILKWDMFDELMGMAQKDVDKGWKFLEGRCKALEPEA